MSAAILPMIEIEQEVVVSDAKFEAHPDSYFPRVFVYVRDNRTWFELLKTGQAIPWKETPEGRGFSFWIADVDYTHDFGMYRPESRKRS